MMNWKYVWFKTKDYPDLKETSCLVRFYEGEYKDIEVYDIVTDSMKQKTVYLKTSILAEREYTFDGIVSKEDVGVFLNKELDSLVKEKAKGAEAVPEQKVTKEPTITAK